MEEKMRKELNTIKMMMNSWIADYRRDLSDSGGNKYLIEMLEEDIADHGVMNFVNRFVETGQLSQEEKYEFTKDVGEKLKEFYEECIEKGL